RFDEVLAALEAAAGWRTERIQRPVLILGELHGVLTGIRQLRRTRPLDTEEVAGLRVPTLAEMARIKAWLLATRHTVRDYLDTVVLFERLGDDGVADALRPFDEMYRQASGVSPLAEVVERLAAAAPADRAEGADGADAAAAVVARGARQPGRVRGSRRAHTGLYDAVGLTRPGRFGAERGPAHGSASSLRGEPPECLSSGSASTPESN